MMREIEKYKIEFSENNEWYKVLVFHGAKYYSGRKRHDKKQ